MMTDYDVPFDDIHTMIAPAWYISPWPYVAIIVVLLIGGTGWFIWARYRTRQRVRQKGQSRKTVRHPSYWSNALHDAQTCQQQAHIYADFLAYLKHVAQQCYSITSTAMTNHEFVAWARDQLPSECAQHVSDIVQHAESVRFERQIVDTTTIKNDYMFVNQVASCMQSGE